MQYVFHQAPIGEGGLEQVKADKSGEEVPIGAVEIAQKQRQQDKTASDGPYIPFHGHNHSSR
jgi:hypothetical protein